MESIISYDKCLKSPPILCISDTNMFIEFKACHSSIGPTSNDSISLKSSFNAGDISLDFQGKSLISLMTVIKSNFPFSESALPLNSEYERLLFFSVSFTISHFHLT